MAGVAQGLRLPCTEVPSGKVTVAMTAAETKALPLGDHVVQIKVAFADGSVRTWPDGKAGPMTMTVVEGLDEAAEE